MCITLVGIFTWNVFLLIKTVSYHKCKVLLNLAHYIKDTIIGVIHDQMLIDKKKMKLLYVGGFGEGKC